MLQKRKFEKKMFRDDVEFQDIGHRRFSLAKYPGIGYHMFSSVHHSQKPVTFAMDPHFSHVRQTHLSVKGVPSRMLNEDL